MSLCHPPYAVPSAVLSLVRTEEHSSTIPIATKQKKNPKVLTLERSWAAFLLN